MERIHPVHQDRAAQTAEVLGEATHQLMLERPFDEIPVTEIARRAGVSVGAFYARFGCKEALLDWLCQERLRGEGEEVLRRLRELADTGADLPELVATYVDLAAGFYERNAVLLRAVVRLAYGAPDEAALEQTIRVNQEVDRACVEVLLSRRDEIRHPQPERAVSLVPVFTASLLRSLILLRPVLAEPEGQWPGGAIREEVSRWILNALRAPV